MEVVVPGGFTASNALVIYPTTQWEWYFPLEQFTESLGLSIHVAPALGTADGWVIQESRKFHLDTKKCHVEYDGATTGYDCAAVIVRDDEIYVLSRELAKWFPIDITINSLRSQVVVNPREKLPEQLRMERESEADRLKGMTSDNDPGYPRVKVPYSLAEGPVLDEQATFGRNTSDNQSVPTFQHNTELGGELLGLEAYALLHGDFFDRTIDQWRFTLARQDPNGGILGPLNLRRAQFFDIDMPALPLVSNVQYGKGFLLSSFPLDLPTRFGSNDFQGPLQPGWEVQLYQNEILIARQVADATGRYFFKGIPLLYGRNLFRLSFYGPHGERRDEYQTFNVGPGLLPEGGHDYRLGVSQLDDTSQRATFEYAQSLAKDFTATTGFLLGGPAPASQTTSQNVVSHGQDYAYVSLLGVNSLFFFQATCAAGSLGGSSCQWAQQMGLGPVVLGGNYTSLFNGYNAEVFNSNISTTTSAAEKSQIDANIAYVIPSAPSIGMTWDVLKKNFVDDTSQTVLTSRLSTSLGMFFLTNNLQYTTPPTLGSDPMIARMELSYIPRLTRYTLAVEYGVHAVDALDFEVQYSDPKYFAITGQGRYPLDGTSPTVNVTASRLLKEITIGLNLQFNSPQIYSAGLLCSFSLTRNPRNGEWEMSHLPQVAYGAASVLVFVDENGNGVWDPGERLVEGVVVTVDRALEGYKTDSRGLAFVPSLKPHAPVDIAISSASIEDPFLRPKNKGVRFYTRPGKTAQIDFPMVVMGQIDGYVTIGGTQSNTRAKRGVSLELLDKSGKVIGKARTDRDGFYVFEDVVPGTYKVRVLDAQLKKFAATSFPEQREVTMPREGAFESGKDFWLKSTQARSAEEESLQP